MTVVLGILFGLSCVIGGYLLHHGSMMVFAVAWTEYVIIVGASVGIFLAGNGFGVARKTVRSVHALLRPNPFKISATYVSLLVMLHQLFSVARRDGLLGIESHIEKPGASPILGRNPIFLGHHHARDFLCDTLKVVVSGGISHHNVTEMMEVDIETVRSEAMEVPDAVANASDAMPAVGIVACVLGVVITMGQIDGEASAVGRSIAVALIGTFLGIMLSYLVVSPIARALTKAVHAQERYVLCIKQAVASFSRGESPATCVEYARREIDLDARPSFLELEAAIKSAKGS